MRSKHKMWRNGRGGQWSSRITWYDESESNTSVREDIRPQLEDSERKVNYYPKSQAEADAVWDIINNTTVVQTVLKEFGALFNYDKEKQ